MSAFVDRYIGWIVLAGFLLVVVGLAIGMVSIFYDAFFKQEIRATFRRPWVRFPLLHFRTYVDWYRYLRLKPHERVNH